MRDRRTVSAAHILRKLQQNQENVPVQPTKRIRIYPDKAILANEVNPNGSYILFNENNPEHEGKKIRFIKAHSIARQRRQCKSRENKPVKPIPFILPKPPNLPIVPLPANAHPHHQTPSHTFFGGRDFTHSATSPFKPILTPPVTGRKRTYLF